MAYHIIVHLKQLYIVMDLSTYGLAIIIYPLFYFTCYVLAMYSVILEKAGAGRGERVEDMEFPGVLAKNILLRISKGELKKK